MDLTDIPKEILLNLKDNKFYKIACIVDNLSKFAYAELISSKQSKEFLPVLMRYVNVKGKPKILLTDNGKEFINNMFKEYLEINNISKRTTRVYNPKCNGIMERFIKTLKDLLLKDYNQNKEDYDIRISLENCLNFYNNKKHNATKLIPFNLFKSKNEEDWKKAIQNNQLNRKTNIKKNIPLMKDQKILICKNFDLKGNKLKFKKFAKKGYYTLPAIILGSASSHEYYVKFPLSFDSIKIKKNKKYICEYRLIKKCSENVYNQILSNL